MNRVQALLRKEIGLDAGSVGATTIERTTRLRMKLHGLTSIEDYHRLLESSREERDELVEAVLVRETWFFRDRDAFTVFTLLAREWIQRGPVGSLRALSVPCSTGEEPYTMAMCLLDARIPPERFTIDAVDVSARSLALATQGVYRKNAFRGKDLIYRDKYFQRAKNGYLLSDAVRACVRFQKDNLLSSKFLSGREPYHFIFCRNVLIYFDQASQRKVVETLRPKLTSAGLLFVGPAEVPIVLDNGFASANLAMAFACHKADQMPQRWAQVRRHGHVGTTRRSVKRTEEATQTPMAFNGDSQDAQISSSPSPTEQTADLQAAHQLADAGHLAEAAAICETYICQHGPSAQAYFLLGLVYDAKGDARAADYYRKALYLEPEHHDALWHMALLLKKNGQVVEANGFRRRAERVQKKT